VFSLPVVREVLSCHVRIAPEKDVSSRRHDVLAPSQKYSLEEWASFHCQINNSIENIWEGSSGRMIAQDSSEF
jgi:hypothetical protein